MQPIEHTLDDLDRRLGENDRNTLELVLALGQLCLQTAERLSLPAAPEPIYPPEQEAAESVEMEAPELPQPLTAPLAATAPEEIQQHDTSPGAGPKPLWRIPLVSSFFLATGGLLLLHYL
jgi:hypothetical protein